MSFTDTGQQFTYRFYDLMTMQYYGDLPLSAVKFGQRLNVAGTFSATLDLTDPHIAMLDPLTATQPSRTLVIVDLNGGIAWGGILWTRQFDRSKPVLTLGGREAGSYWERRVQAADYTTTWSTTGAPAATIAAQVLTDAQAVSGSAFADMIIEITNLDSPPNVQVSYPLTQFQTVDKIVSDLTSLGYGTGCDATYIWRYDVDGVPYLVLFLTFPRSGKSPTYTLAGPIQALDVQAAYNYTWPEDGSTQANKVYLTGSNLAGATINSAVEDDTSLTAGYPLLEEVVNFNTINTASQLTALAEGELATHTNVPTVPTVDVDPSGVFTLGGYGVGGFYVGDDVRLIVPQQVAVPPVSDERFPAGLDATDPTTPNYRITGYDATISDEGVSKLTLALSMPPPALAGLPADLYLMNLLKNLQSQIAGLSTGSYGTGLTYATVVVAANNSQSLNADFVCTGTSDQTVIGLALEALRGFDETSASGGGQIVILDGDLYFDGPLVLGTGPLPVVITGQGRDATVIHASTDTTLVSIAEDDVYNQTSTVFRDIGFVNYLPGDTWGTERLVNVTTGDEGTTATVAFYECSFESHASPGISIAQSLGAVVDHCYFSCQRAVEVYNSIACSITNNYFINDNAPDEGGRFPSFPWVSTDSNCYLVQISGNRFDGGTVTPDDGDYPAGYALQLSGTRIEVSDNNFVPPINGELHTLGLIGLYDATNCAVIDNILGPLEDESIGLASGAYAVAEGGASSDNVIAGNVCWGWNISPGSIHYGNTTGSGDVDGFPYPTVVTSPTATQVLTWNGSEWVNADASGGGGPTGPAGGDLSGTYPDRRSDQRQPAR